MNTAELAGGPVPGAKVYSYDYPRPVNVTVPPPDFDFRSATPEELAALGIPEEPKTAEDRLRWREMIGNMKPMRPPAEMLSAPYPGSPCPNSPVYGVAGSECGYEWGGGMLLSPSSTAVTEVHTYYYEPTASYGSCGTNVSAAAYYWNGIGGYPYNPSAANSLAQNGTAQSKYTIVPGDPNPTRDSIWWELLPLYGNAAQFPFGSQAFATPGQVMYTSTSFLGYSNGYPQYQFYWYNYANGRYFTVYAQGNYGSVDSSHAEFTAEIPGQNPNALRLLPYSTFSAVPYANNALFTSYANQYRPLTLLNASNGNSVLAKVTSLTPSSGVFNSTWQNCF